RLWILANRGGQFHVQFAFSISRRRGKLSPAFQTIEERSRKMSSSAVDAEVSQPRVMPWIVRGDIDGFFGLALDNLIQLLLIADLCAHVLQFPNELIYGRILPGAAISVLVGNLFYAWQARELSRKTGRTDICALPYGINTVSVFGHVLLVMLPAKLAAEA